MFYVIKKDVKFLNTRSIHTEHNMLQLIEQNNFVDQYSFDNVACLSFTMFFESNNDFLWVDLKINIFHGEYCIFTSGKI